MFISIPLPFKKANALFWGTVLFAGELYEFLIYLSPYQIDGLRYFLPFQRLLFHFADCFFSHEQAFWVDVVLII